MHQALDTLLPSWLGRLDAPPSSRDPLGLQATALVHADALLPGLNVFTSRARYFPFLCWAIDHVSELPPRGQLDALLRLERLLVLCEALEHQEDPNACAYVGRRRARRFIKENAAGGLWELPTRILKNQATNGAFRLYRTSLVDLGLAEPDEFGDGLGLALTPLGEKLAQHYSKCVDDGLASWALGPAETRKREQTLLSTAAAMCLSARIGAHERRLILTALFGATESGLRRRETARVLFQESLLEIGAEPDGGDLAADDEDVYLESSETSARSAIREVVSAELHTNWRVVRAMLEMPARDEVRPFQLAASHEVLALAANAVFMSAATAASGPGRLSVRDWLAALRARGGDDFGAIEARAWAPRESVAQACDAMFAAEAGWQSLGLSGARLLLSVLQNDRVVAWVEEASNDVASPVLSLRADLESKSAQDMLATLLPELVARHHMVSTRKGKAEWMLLEDGEIVRGDHHDMPVTLHSLRFTQFERIAADLGLDAEDLSDEA